MKSVEINRIKSSKNSKPPLTFKTISLFDRVFFINLTQYPVKFISF